MTLIQEIGRKEREIYDNLLNLIGLQNQRSIVIEHQICNLNYLIERGIFATP